MPVANWAITSRSARWSVSGSAPVRRTATGWVRGCGSWYAAMSVLLGDRPDHPVGEQRGRVDRDAQRVGRAHGGQQRRQ